jgi:hypothetical protein
MAITLFLQNVVIAAKQFNPSIMSELWLVRNQIIAEGSCLPGSVFADALVNVITREFTLIALPNQLQFVPTPADAGALVNNKVGEILRLLPHTPYKAIGLNFLWHVIGEDVVQLSRDLFYREDSSIFRAFNTTDAQFGAYLSKQMLGMRMKLDIKPIVVEGNGPKEGRLQFGFNFHYDAPTTNAAEDLQRVLHNWDAVATSASDLVHNAVRRTQ